MNDKIWNGVPMNTKELIAAEIAKVVPELEQENIQNLLETPKNADMGDLAFPAFSLAKVLDKSSLKAATTLTKTSVTDVTSPLICLVLTSLNLSLSVTYVQQLSLTLLPTS